MGFVWTSNNLFFNYFIYIDFKNIKYLKKKITIILKSPPLYIKMKLVQMFLLGWRKFLYSNIFSLSPQIS